MADLVGQTLGNYQLLRLLGQGGFADVYLGTHHYLKTTAAVKVLHSRITDDTLPAFLREAQTIARLDHPHIIRVLDCGVEDTTAFLVMSYAAHGTLRQRHPRGSKLDREAIVSYVLQIASALQYAHDQKIVHRDLKPENLLVGGNQDILLSDFGLAIIAQSSSAGSRGPRFYGGTTAYMAPEQLEGKPGRASDQYALGMIAYEWFCGYCAFDGLEHEVAVQQIGRTPPSMYVRVPTLSPAIEAVVMKALAKDPKKRFSSIQEFAYALEEASISGTVPMEAVHAVSSLPQHKPVTDITPPLSDRAAEIVLMKEHTVPPVARSDNHAISTSQPICVQGLVQDSQLPSISVIPPSVIQPPVTQPPATPSSVTEPDSRAHFPSRRQVTLGIVGLIATGLIALGWEELSQKDTLLPILTKSKSSDTTTAATPAHGTAGGTSTGKQPSQMTNAATSGKTPPENGVTPSGTSPQSGTTAQANPTAQTGGSPQSQQSPLTVQIVSSPSQVSNKSGVPIQVATNQGSVPVTLKASYSTWSNGFQSSPVSTDSDGNASILWSVNMPPGQVKPTTVATLVVTANDQNNNQVTSPAVTVTVVK